MPLRQIKNEDAPSLPSVDPNDELNIKIRLATIADQEFIVSLVPRLTEFGPPDWRNRQAMIETDIKILTGKLSDTTFETAIFIAEDKQKIKLGFIHLTTGSDYYFQEKHGHISDIIVAPEGEGKGIGSRLMAKAEEWARLHGYRWLTLSVFAQNLRARYIYEKIGYGADIIKYVKELDQA